MARVEGSRRRGALAETDGATLEAAAVAALELRLPLVGVLASSGVDVHDGLGALHGWGRAARAMAACSGVVPVVLAVIGPAISGPALLLGMADAVVMTPESVAYVSGPAAVAEMTGFQVSPDQLGGAAVHARSTGVAALTAADAGDAEQLLAELVSYLPDHADATPPVDPAGGRTRRTG